MCNFRNGTNCRLRRHTVNAHKNTAYWLPECFPREKLKIALRPLCFAGLTLVCVAPLLPAAHSPEIQFANRQKASGIQFVLDNSPTPRTNP